jgi:hypothetical protein
LHLTAPPNQPTLDDYMEHVEHALKTAGTDHVGIGSDVGIDPFDISERGRADFNNVKEERRSASLAAPEEDRLPYVIGLNFPRKVEIIADQLLKRGYTAAVAEKVRGEFRRSPSKRSGRAESALVLRPRGARSLSTHSPVSASEKMVARCRRVRPYHSAISFSDSTCADWNRRLDPHSMAGPYF